MVSLIFAVIDTVPVMSVNKPCPDLLTKGVPSSFTQRTTLEPTFQIVPDFWLVMICVGFMMINFIG